jgi:cell division protein FtsL
MSQALPQNRKLKRARPREDGLGRSVRDATTGGTLRRLLRRVGQVVWPERFPGAMSERRQVKPRGFIWIWAFSVTLAVAAFVTHLHVRFDIIQAGYSLSQAQAEQRQLRLAQRELRLELATIKEPGRIERQARELLGMDRPNHDRIIRLGDGTQLARRR